MKIDQLEKGAVYTTAYSGELYIYSGETGQEKLYTYGRDSKFVRRPLMFTIHRSQPGDNYEGIPPYDPETRGWYVATQSFKVNQAAIRAKVADSWAEWLARQVEHEELVDHNKAAAQDMWSRLAACYGDMALIQMTGQATASPTFTFTIYGFEQAEKFIGVAEDAGLIHGRG